MNKTARIEALTIKLLGKKDTVYRCYDSTGEMVHVFYEKSEAEAWLKGAA